MSDEMTDQYRCCTNSGDFPSPPDYRELAMVLMARYCGSGVVMYSADEAARAKQNRVDMEVTISGQRIVRPLLMGS